MTSTTAYETLYENLKNRFTVVNDNCECTLGEYMLAKARETANAGASLPIAVNDYSGSRKVLQGIVSYVNERLTIKKAPVKDKTMRAFPLRTSLASLMSALLVCTLVVTYGLAGGKSLSASDESASADYNAIESYDADSYNEELPEYEAAETENH